MSIEVDAGSPYYSSLGGVLFNKDMTYLIRCPNAKSGSFTIPEGVTGIGERAFSNCSRLASVTIPPSVTRIGWSAFSVCRLTAYSSGDAPAALDKGDPYSQLKIRYIEGKKGWSTPTWNGYAAEPVSHVFTITATAAPGGSISPFGTIPAASGERRILVFNITPDIGYAAKDILLDGVSTGATASYALGNVTADHTVSAVFEKGGPGAVGVATARLKLMPDVKHLGCSPSLKNRPATPADKLPPSVKTATRM